MLVFKPLLNTGSKLVAYSSVSAFSLGLGFLIGGIVACRLLDALIDQRAEEILSLLLAGFGLGFLAGWAFFYGDRPSKKSPPQGFFERLYQARDAEVVAYARYFEAIGLDKGVVEAHYAWKGAEAHLRAMENSVGALLRKSGDA